MLKQAYLRPFRCLVNIRGSIIIRRQCITGGLAATRSFQTLNTSREEKSANVTTDISSDATHPTIYAPSPSIDEKDDAVAKNPEQDSSNIMADTPPSEDKGSSRKTKAPTPSDFDLESLRNRFRELSLQSFSMVRQRADEFTVNTAKNFTQLGAHLNKVTGYEEIENLKRRVIEQGESLAPSVSSRDLFSISENKIESARETARRAKQAYDEAVIQRSNSQKEVNDLLHRKASWGAAERDRITTLIIQEHECDQRESQTKAAVIAAEDAVDRTFSELLVP